MKTLILAGGGGSRLWPVSRQDCPKQFLNFFGNHSLLVNTIHRAQAYSPKAEDIFLVTNPAFMPRITEELLRNDLPEILDNVICEPLKRNTGPAIGLAAEFMRHVQNVDLDEVVVILAADHAIPDVDAFARHAEFASRVAQDGFIVTFGVHPTHPETGYGYIEIENQINSPYAGSHDLWWHPVDRFVEKPDVARAQTYVDSGRHFWNSGIFVMTLRTLLQAFELYAPTIGANLTGNFEASLERFHQMPNISFDHAVMEQAGQVNQVAMVPLRTLWSDVGCWDSVHTLLDKDANGNASMGSVVSVDTRSSMIFNQGERLIATVGVEDLLIIDTDKALLVCKRGQSQSVRDIVDQLPVTEDVKNTLIPKLEKSILT